MPLPSPFDATIPSPLSSNCINGTPGDSFKFTFAEAGIDLPIPEPIDDFIGATVFFPELDTPDTGDPTKPSDNGDPLSSVFANGKITNTKLTSNLAASAANTGETDIDVLRVELDLDAILTTLVTGGRYTDGFGVDVEGFIKLFLASFDLQAFLGIGQTFDFTPNLKVDLQFSQPTEVETFPGSGVFSMVTTKRIAVGQQIQAKTPRR